MKPEIEAKFLNVDHDELRAKLKAIGATCRQPMRLMHRKNYDFPDFKLEKTKTGWARVRDEGDKITMSYKQLDDRSLTGTKEIQLVIDDFANGCSFLESLGLAVTSDQQTRRESWQLGDLEIELDEWPWARPYIEIEGPDEASLKGIANQLGLDWAKVCHGSVELVYQAEYNVTDEQLDHIAVINFDTPPPKLLADNKL